MKNKKLEKMKMTKYDKEIKNGRRIRRRRKDDDKRKGRKMKNWEKMKKN